MQLERELSEKSSTQDKERQKGISQVVNPSQGGSRCETNQLEGAPSMEHSNAFANINRDLPQLPSTILQSEYQIDIQEAETNDQDSR